MGLEPTTTYFVKEHSTETNQFAKWLNVRLRTKWLCVRVHTTSDITPFSSKEFLDIQATKECEFTLKRLRDMIKTYRQYTKIFVGAFNFTYINMSAWEYSLVKNNNNQKPYILRIKSKM